MKKAIAPPRHKKKTNRKREIIRNNCINDATTIDWISFIPHWMASEGYQIWNVFVTCARDRYSQVKRTLTSAQRRPKQQWQNHIAFVVTCGYEKIVNARIPFPRMKNYNSIVIENEETTYEQNRKQSADLKTLKKLKSGWTGVRDVCDRRFVIAFCMRYAPFQWFGKQSFKCYSSDINNL